MTSYDIMTSYATAVPLFAFIQSNLHAMDL